jgi:hypothetical protein
MTNKNWEGTWLASGSEFKGGIYLVSSRSIYISFPCISPQKDHSVIHAYLNILETLLPGHHQNYGGHDYD